LAEKPEGRRTLGRPKHRWEDKFSVCSLIAFCLVIVIKTHTNCNSNSYFAGEQTLSFTVTKYFGLGVCEIRGLRRMFGPKKCEVSVTFRQILLR
jgi:hypothetical protein